MFWGWSPCASSPPSGEQFWPGAKGSDFAPEFWRRKIILRHTKPDVQTGTQETGSEIVCLELLEEPKNIRNPGTEVPTQNMHLWFGTNPKLGIKSSYPSTGGTLTTPKTRLHPTGPRCFWVLAAEMAAPAGSCEPSTEHGTEVQKRRHTKAVKHREFLGVRYFSHLTTMLI